jgi:hypothetical protein
VTTIDIEAWAIEQQEQLTADLKVAKVELAEQLEALRACIDDPVGLRVALNNFEDVEMNISGDLVLLSPLYERLPDEYGWAEADDEELRLAARGAFGGEAP